MDEALVQEMLEKVNDIISTLEEHPDEAFVVVEELTYQLKDELETISAEE